MDANGLPNSVMPQRTVAAPPQILYLKGRWQVSRTSLCLPLFDPSIIVCLKEDQNNAIPPIMEVCLCSPGFHGSQFLACNT